MPKKLPEILIHFLEDCLEGDPRFRYKSMFGGYGVYKYDKIFAIFTDGQLFFKVGENNIQDYKSYWKQPFQYTKKWGKVCSLCYYEVPEEILEEREVLMEWIEKSVEVMKSK